MRIGWLPVLALTASILGIAGVANAQQRLAVLEFSGDGSLEEDVLGLLADRVRGAALRHLDMREWEVMTQENMLVLLEANASDLAACEGECEVETGQLIGADRVVSGRVQHAGSRYWMMLKIFETRSGRLDAIEEVAAEDVDALLDATPGGCERLFAAGDHAATAGMGGAGSGERGSGVRHLDEARTFEVRFESTPPGAAVSLDGTLLCDATPCVKEVAEGVHDVETVLARYETARQRLDVQRAGVTNASLSPLFGWVSIHSSAPGVKIEVDGQSAGMTPVQRLELAPGRHSVLVEDDRYLAVGEEFMIERGAERIIQLSAVAKPTVEVSSASPAETRRWGTQDDCIADCKAECKAKSGDLYRQAKRVSVFCDGWPLLCCQNACMGVCKFEFTRQ